MEARDRSTPAYPVRLDVLGPSKEVLYSGEYVKEKIVLGRILSADLRIDDPRVSRIHALLEVRDNKLLLTDLASTHGTFVNGKKVVEAEVKPGDTIKLGFICIAVEKGSGESVPASIPSTEDRGVFDSEETLVNIDRRALEELERRDSHDRRKKNAFPEERRLDERRDGDRRIDQRQGERRDEDAEKTVSHETKKTTERRRGKDRRQKRDWERRVGERRKGDRRVFDITSLERRIEDRRARTSDDDVLPEELEAAFTEPEHARELEVTVLWGDHILDVSNYKDPVIINIGESPKNNYVIPSQGIPDEFPLITINEDGTAYLAFTDTMKGTIRARDKIYSINDLKNEKFIRKFGGYFILPLRRDDFAKLSIGSINFFILYVKPAPRIKPAPIFDRDKLFLKTLIGSFLFLLLLIGGLALIPEPKPVTIEMIPERFVKIVIRKRPKIKDPDIVKPKAKPIEKGSKKAEGGKPKKKEAKAKAPKKKTKKAAKKQAKKKAVVKKQRRKPRRRKTVNKQRAKSVGILKALGGAKSDLKNLLDKDTGLDAFDKSVSAFRGRGARGGRGKAIKGVDAGGGGKTIGIEGPSTKGIGGGASGSGIGEGIQGPGRLGRKGEHTVSVITENVQVLSGLPKDVINAVVQRHRGEIRQCYEAARQRNPSLRGKVVVGFKIQPSGRVSWAGVKSSTVGDSRLANCIVSRVRSWKFPEPEAPVVTEVSAYPFYLNPGN